VLKILLSLVLIFSCSKQPANLKLGFIIKQPDEPWFQLEWKFAEEASKKYGFELIKIAATDGEKVLSAIDNLAANGASGFVICTPDVRLGPAIKMKAQSAGLKMIAVDDQFIGADGKSMTDVPYLGISAREIGKSVGTNLYSEMKKRNWNLEEVGTAIVTFDEMETGRERTEGAIESLLSSGFPEGQIYKIAQKTSDIPGSFDAVNILLTQKPKVKKWLIAGLNDNAVLGAVRAMEGRGFKPENMIGIGINGSEAVVEFEKKNETGLYASVLLSAKDHGFKTIEMLYHWVKEGTEPSKDTRTTGVLITRANFEQILKDQGIR
jgi:L-arabinose transport system substrate-binding protein